MMQTSTTAKLKSTRSLTPVRSPLLQRKCACGNSAGLTGTCSDCQTQNLTLQRRSTEPTEGAEVPPLVHELLPIQTKLTIGKPGDVYEQEADRVADEVMRMPEPKIQCEEEEKKEGKRLQTKTGSNEPSTVSSSLQNSVTGMQGGGQPLPQSEQAFFESKFGVEFSPVSIHADKQAAEKARAVNARAFTLGQNIVFGAGQYQPRSIEGRRLLAHELTHVVQQVGVGENQAQSRTISPTGEPRVQRTLGDGHDLASPRFSLLLDLEAAYDDENVIVKGSSGGGVQAIQQALYDLGFSLPSFGADGNFGSETKAAVEAFQRANPSLAVDGKVGKKTMEVLDARFGTPILPSVALRSAPWTPSCVCSILCPWSPHTIDVLKTRITLKSFDSISWADEMWDGATWVPAPFPGGGYHTGTEIGVLNSSCEHMSETLYHEVLHADQPMTHTTTKKRESYAYRIGEEFSIAMGLGGRANLRSTDVKGRQFADPTKVESFVTVTYPSVPAGGGGDEIIGKAATHGEVEVQRSSGTIYTRPAAVGEKVPGSINLVNEVIHPKGGWTCP